MKPKAGAIAGLLAAPPPSLSLFLFYGPDEGLARERFQAVSKTLLGSPEDPFRVSELSLSDLKDDPSRLADEAAAIAFGGGRKVVKLRGGTDALAKPVAAFLDHPMGDGLILILAGDLPARSSLRKAVEASDHAAAIPCYSDGQKDLHGVIQDSMAQAGLRIEPDAIDVLMDHLGSDRGITRSELDKLALYAQGSKTVTVDDVMLCVGDTSALSIDRMIHATAEGTTAEALGLCDRLLGEGTSVVTILRAFSRHFLKLHWLSGQTQSGNTPDQAVDRLQPRVFFKDKPRLIKQCRQWPAAKVDRANALIMAAEAEAKQTGAPDRVLCERLILRLCQAARVGSGPARTRRR
ncbi:MAG: DNA polymerase III subunit delta [Rhodospirillaceae bacterium]